MRMVTVRIAHVCFQATTKKTRAGRKPRESEQKRKDSKARQSRSKKKGQQRSPSSQQKENTRVVELEATIRRIKIVIVVGVGIARLLQLQSHTQSSCLLVCWWVFRDQGVGVVVVKG
jgi:hypothetical protein